MEQLVDTIAAVATAPGTGAIAIVRLSGPDTERIIGTVFRGKSGRSPVAVPRKLLLGWLVDSHDRRVDQVLAVFFPAGSSYTGEDQAEIHCHGGPVVAGEVLRVVVEAGAREARAGEFTRRAYQNGVVDLARAEAVLQVIEAVDAEQVRAAARLLAGELTGKLDWLVRRCADLTAELEAAIEFPDDVELSPRVGAGLVQLRDELRRLLSGLRLGGQNRPSVVLCGPPNAGKSTLANLLVGRDMAIVTSRAGTTRDAVSGDMVLGQRQVRLVDTAGMVPGHEPSDEISRLSLAAGLREAGAATVLVWMCEVDNETQPLDGLQPDLLVTNKIDLLGEKMGQQAQPDEQDRLMISAARGWGLDRLRRRLTRELEAKLGPPGGLPVSARQQAHLARARDLIESAGLRVEEGLLELASEDLHRAVRQIESVGGHKADGELLDLIFSRFCVGK